MTIRAFSFAAIAAALAAATPAHAEEEPASPFTITGTVGVFSQYRLRGVSQSNEDVALQGSITVAHESGFYVSTWGSNLAGFGSFGGSNVEIDLIGGYGTKIGDLGLDGGLIWYLYPGTDGTDYAEIYGSISHPIGPVNAKLGFYYAPEQDALGSEDNIWVYTDLAFPIADTPITLKGHLGYTKGDGTLAGPDGEYLDYMVGVDFTWKNLTFNASYVDTDLKDDLATAGFYGTHDIVDGAALFSVTAAF